jgi:type II secretory pathway component PulF
MPTFSYRALQPDGRMADGIAEAASRPEALRIIEGKGLRPVSVTETRGGGSRSSKPGKEVATQNTGMPGFSFGAPRVSGAELENFTRLLSSLLAAGVPLSRALTILGKEASSPVASAKWREIHGLVVDGMSLANAMARSSDTFPKVYTAMVEAGEAGGFLDVVLAQIADFQSREKELRSKVLTAMIYPAVLLVMALVVLTVLLVFFIPKFQKVFASAKGALPLITQIIIAASDILRSYGLLVLVGLVLGGFFLRTWIISPAGRRIWEGLTLKAPVVGPLSSRFAMARFCRMLGTLIGADVQLIQALNVARRSIGNQILVDAVARSIDQVQQGGRLGQSLAECPALFSGSVMEMISVAEESGRLDVELIRIANVTESELDRRLKTAVALAEPLMLFLIAGFIGFIFIGMLLPVFSLQDYIK